MRTPSIRRPLASVAGALILYGCAAHPVDVDLKDSGGYIAARPGRPGMVIAAPPGTSDGKTGDIAAELARRTGFGLVVATGVAREPDRAEANRSSEGLPGRPANQEFPTDDARRVDEAYEDRVRAAAQGPLVFYAEIHGNNRREAAGRIEVATVGVTPADALRLRALLELIREAHLRSQASAPRLEVRVEPADPLVSAASGAKRVAILRLPERALHIELPRSARTEWQEVYTAILADFLSQAVALPSGK